MPRSNGNLRAGDLSPIPGGKLARGGPARSYLAMRHYIGKRYGVWLRPTGPWSSYRPLWKQSEFYRAFLDGRGPLAARPGTSNHGLGRAVDLPSAAMQRLVARHGHEFGWGIAGGRLSSDAPSESWHATYRGPYGLHARRWYWKHRIAARRARRRR
jgi:hypothetical protein